MARKKGKGKDNPNTAFTAEEPQEQPPTQPTHQPTRSRTSKQANLSKSRRISPEAMHQFKMRIIAPPIAPHVLERLVILQYHNLWPHHILFHNHPLIMMKNNMWIKQNHPPGGAKLHIPQYLSTMITLFLHRLLAQCSANEESSGKEFNWEDTDLSDDDPQQTPIQPHGGAPATPSRLRLRLRLRLRPRSRAQAHPTQTCPPLTPQRTVTVQHVIRCPVDFTQTPPRRTTGTGMGGRRQRRANNIHSVYKETETHYVCMFCKIKEEMQNPKFEVQIYEFSSSNTNLWKHMLEHLPEWIAHCDAHGYTIDAKCVNEEVALYRQENDMLTALATLKIEKFSVEGLIARLEELIIAEDLPIAFMESEHVINVILYLQRDLTKDDIPGQTTMTKIILDTYRAHMYELTVELKTALGKISFTCDGWTDNLLYPFIAITAHWIQEVTVIQKSGKGVVSQTVLKLHANVIAFHELPVSHTGVHLGEAFLYLLGRLGLTKKIGWVTCDNATNNDGMFHRLHKRLQMTNIDFHWYHNHIRCFAHIIHLAITAILDKMDAIDLAEIFANREGVSLPGGRSGVCWASSQRQIAFETLVRQARNRQELLLVQDITNCWSSSHNMLKRAIILHPQLEEFKLDQNHGQDIAPHILNKYEWMAVEVPHAFQHVLSIEETPCLAFTIPAFHAVIDNWQVLQDNDPDFYAIIKQGIKKLDDYLEHIRDVPAYFLSMSACIFIGDRLVDAEFTYVQHGGKDAYKASYIFFNNIISETYLNIDLSTGF
ncbi:hat family dimerization domain-containing protein [Moniliophthora roreri MCA 2997]|uniref:Hat family dimerization domain-containing protein n=1 Tax=Moniliophthora roreri (strain MCA 2997) TaxID=1381753 RepID=V2WRW2_MONRO|nr:hat family dimerization domain-containing protein [Moniliophthora roreri MCA 2997]